MDDELIQKVYTAFRSDLKRIPDITLRAGVALDIGLEPPPPYNPVIDAPTDAYLDTYADGLPFLDVASWRHYLPRLLDYALRYLSTTVASERPSGRAIEDLLSTLRPPDWDPPRLGSLSAEQEAVVTAVLEELAFNDNGRGSPDFAMQVLEEWWWPNPRYRPHPPPAESE